MTKYRFVNPAYGKRSRGGFVPHIAVLFFGDEVFHDEEEHKIRFARPDLEPVDASSEALAVLRGGDFSELVTCEHRFLSGESCTSKPLPGEKLCKFHARKPINCAPSRVAAYIAESPVPLVETDRLPTFAHLPEHLPIPTSVVENDASGDNPA